MTPKFNTAREEEFFSRAIVPGRPALVVTVGLPRSGKTSWAVQTGWPIVNIDSVRLAFQDRPFLHGTEGWIWMIVRTMVKALFFAGHRTVVLDGLFVSPGRRAEWTNSEIWGPVWRVFTTAPAVCLERAHDSGRDDLTNSIHKLARDWRIEPGLSPMFSDGDIHEYRKLLDKLAAPYEPK